MQIRIATMHDIELLTQLRMAYLNTNDTDTYSILYDYFYTSISSDSLFAVIGEIDGDAISCAMMSVSQRPPRRAEENIIGVVYNVYTHPQHRRKGYARAAMAALLTEAKRRSVTTVELLAAPDGLHLYESMGFVSPKYACLRLNL